MTSQQNPDTPGPANVAREAAPDEDDGRAASAVTDRSLDPGDAPPDKGPGTEYVPA